MYLNLIDYQHADVFITVFEVLERELLYMLVNSGTETELRRSNELVLAIGIKVPHFYLYGLELVIVAQFALVYIDGSPYWVQIRAHLLSLVDQI